MSPEMKQLVQYIAPMLGLLLFTFLIWFIKLNLDRQKYAKKSENHALIGIIPKAGKFVDYLVPITLEGGVALVKIPDKSGKITESSPTHILGEDGEYPIDYPRGKTKFVQATVTGLTYYEGDAEPLSNVSNRPVISAQLITNLADGISTATADALKRSQEESDGNKVKKGSPLMWILVFVGLNMAIGVFNIIVQVQASKATSTLIDLVQKAIGVK